MSPRAIRDGAAVTLYVTPVGDDQAYLSFVARDGADDRQAADEAYRMVAELLRERQMEIVHERVFGSLKADTTVQTVRRKVLRECGISPETPVTYLQGRPLRGEGLAGASLLAVRPSGADSIWTIADATGRPCGRGWKREGVTFLILQNLHGRREDLETPRMVLSLHKRASQAEETEVAPDDPILDEKPTETKTKKKEGIGASHFFPTPK